MKYMVIVNCKYLVMVEAQSAGGAEHVILDNVYYGIETCQAFSLKETSTQFFADYAANCETISLSEMEKKAAEYKTHLDKKQQYATQIESLKRAIEHHEREIELAKENIMIFEANIKTAEESIKVVW